MKLIVTIDTEEDNWGSYNPSGNTVENIGHIPELQELFDRYDVKPTYLLTYPVATDDKSVSLLRGIMERGGCEIGTHCHPWNTPPFEETTGPKNSMLCNLPSELQYKKIKNLHEIIKSNFEIKPVSFRCGRWGLNEHVIQNLSKLGYKIDTSVTPYTDWTRSYGPDMSESTPHPYEFKDELILPGFQLIEVPATVGFLQSNFQISDFIYNISVRYPFRLFRLAGILDLLNINNKVWLSPEVSNSKQMIALAKRMMKNRQRFINMVFHSSTLKSGLTPFVRTLDDEKRFLRNIEEFLIFSRNAGIESIKLCEALNYL